MSRLACVTGATGFLGRRVLSSLLKDDDHVRVRCLVRGTSDLDTALRRVPVTERTRVEFVRGELTDRTFLSEQLREADVLYHLAASLAGSTSAMFLNTVLPTRRVIEAATEVHLPRFVLVSSLGVYGTAGLRNRSLLTEETPIDPHPQRRDPYTFSKIRQEWVAWQSVEQTGLRLVVVRPGVIYGPGRDLLTSRVGLSLGPLLIRMGGSQNLPYTFVENCADAIVLAGRAPDIEGEVFNVVDDDLPTGIQIVKSLRRSGRQLRTVWVPRMMINPLSAVYHWYSQFSDAQLPPVITPYKSNAIWKPLRFCNAKAKHRLNWAPEISTEEGIRRTIAG